MAQLKGQQPPAWGDAPAMPPRAGNHSCAAAHATDGGPCQRGRHHGKVHHHAKQLATSRVPGFEGDVVVALRGGGGREGEPG
jgi:hypothetical protein